MKKRIGSVLLALALCLSLLPATALAEDTGGTGTSVNVETKEEFKNALNNNDATEIHITGDIVYSDSLNSRKTIYIDNGATLTLSANNATVSGTIVNNGTIQVKSRQKCIWSATTTGTGKLIGGKDPWNYPSTYVDYGCVPEAMLDGCRINIVKDISQSVTAALPDPMQTGDTISVTFSNLIDGVNPADVFKFTWKDGNDFQLYDNAATPTLTKPGVLKLSLTPKNPYVMCTSFGTNGSLDAQGTVTQKRLGTVYVDQSNGNDSNLGDTAAQPVKSIDKALDKITDDGQIVLLSNYSGRIVFRKSVTVKCEDGNAFTLTSSSPNYVSDGVTVTLEKLNFSDSNFCKNTQGTGSLVFKNCTGSLSIGTGDISSITINNSQLGGNISATNSLTMNTSTFSGQFNTKNFSADGDCTINCKKNSPSRISGTITVPAGTTVKLVPFENAKAGDKLLEVPNSTAANSFALSDTSGAYGVVFSEQSNGKYLRLAQRITSENGKIAVANEPKNKDTVYVPANVRLDGFASGVSLDTAMWSGNTNSTWSTGETPELIVTLKANDFYFFDSSFSADGVKVYSWTYMSSQPSFEDTAKNNKVTCTVKEHQGASADGKTYTFTIQYPEISIQVLGVTLDKTSMSLTAGSTGTLTATINPADATNKNLTWTSDNGAVATVSQTGVVTAVAEGTAKITVKTADGEKTAVCTVTVTAKTSGSSSSSSSSRPSYPITTPDKTENGSVNISSTSAKRGSVVTITVTPDAGYVLDKLTVTDKDGKELSLTKKSDTEYTFVMPAGKVEITPSFVKQAEEPSRVFVDVKTGDYFYDAVQWAVGKGITNGTSAETFSPEAPCTRAQIVTFLWRAAGSPVVNYAMDLSDVAGDAYYAEAVRWALSEGITTGTSADQFSPDATCTREQAVTFLYRAAGSPAVSGESAFEDVGADAYYARAVAWAAQNGVTNGISQVLFGTGSDCTRAQIVTFLYRAQQGK